MTAAVATKLNLTGSMGRQYAEEAAPSKGASFDRVEPLYELLKKPGDTVLFRFLMDLQPQPSAPDAWVTVHMHNFLSTKPKPADYKGNFPPKLSPVCRKAKLFVDNGLFPEGCWICDNVRLEGGKPARAMPRTWALVVVREDVIGDAAMLAENLIEPHQVGQIVMQRDKMKTVAVLDSDGKPTGDEKLVPDIRLAVYPYDGFYNIAAGHAGRKSTLLNKDLQVTRRGEGTDTSYDFSSLDETDSMVLHPETNELVPMDLRDPKLMNALYPQVAEIDLGELIMDKADDEFYAKFFVTDGSITVPGAEGGAKATTPSQTPAAPAPEVGKADLAALRARMTQRTG